MAKLKLALVPFLLSDSASLHQAQYQKLMAPLGLLNLASYIETLDLSVDILIHNDIEEVIRFKPEVVGISSVSENFNQTQEFAKKLKNLINPFIVLGGAHFTSLPTFLPDCFDAGVVGEGELVLEQILRTFIDKSISKEFIKDIPGIVTSIENKLEYTPSQTSIKNLNTLPTPNRNKWLSSVGIPHIMSSRGCIYHCFFCSEPTLFKSYREISAEKIIEEIEDILTHYPQTKHIRFYDDIFTINRKRLRDFCKLIDQKKINERINFSCFIHAKMVDEELAILLKKANFSFVLFGADSGSLRILKSIKPSSSVEMNQKSIDILHTYDVKVGATFIIGTPDETEEDIKSTIQFIYKNRKKLIEVEMNPAIVLPGTDLWSYAIKNKKIPPPEKMDWEALRDPARLIEFDFDRYIYLADQIEKKVFKKSLQQVWELTKEIYQIHQTPHFMLKNYMNSFTPLKFKNRI